MRKVLNKSIVLQTKEDGPGAELQTGKKSPDQDLMSFYTDAIAEADRMIQAAAKAKETAASSAEYIAAVTSERSAIDTKRGYQRKLADLTDNV